MNNEYNKNNNTDINLKDTFKEGMKLYFEPLTKYPKTTITLSVIAALALTYCEKNDILPNDMFPDISNESKLEQIVEPNMLYK